MKIVASGESIALPRHGLMRDAVMPPPAVQDSTPHVAPFPTPTIPQAPSKAAPPYRRLRTYAFDPSLDTQLDLAMVNQVTVQIPWEHDLKPGPVGEYLEVIDYD